MGVGVGVPGIPLEAGKRVGIRWEMSQIRCYTFPFGSDHNDDGLGNCWAWPHAKATGGDAKSGKRNLQKHLKMFKKKNNQLTVISPVSQFRCFGESDGVPQGSVVGPVFFSRGHVCLMFDLMTKVSRVKEIWNHKVFKLTNCGI